MKPSRGDAGQAGEAWMLDGLRRAFDRRRPPPLAPLAGSAGASGGVGSATADLIARADAARDAGQFGAAAALYDEALRLLPGKAAIHVQCGHMYKESGDLDRAEAHYAEAGRLTPDDPDLALQLGHFFKVAARPDDAAAAYRRALDLKPGWAEPARELEALRTRNTGDYSHLAEEARTLGLADGIERLVPELAPRTPDALGQRYVDGVHVSRLGARRERSVWGVMNTLRGIEAIRGYCISSAPLTGLQVALDGTVIHSGALQAFDLPPAADGTQRKYVFNVWLDFAPVASGPHLIELRFLGPAQGARVHRERVVVAPPLREADYPDSDALLDPLGPEENGQGRTLEELINARPSIVRPARRALFAEPPRSVLVMRTDQLGDMVTSIPAVRRLRELLPRARLVGLVTQANADFARTLGLFDEVLVADFPDDREERRRVMPLDVQEALRARLAPYRFDLAIDLAESAMSRPLLLLSGARFLYGFSGGDWPWLDGGFEGNTRDRRNGLERAAQSTKVLALVERLGAALGSPAQVIRRDDLSRDVLAPLGLTETDRYAVLHTGARIGFSRWLYYPELATLLLARTELKVVLLTDDAAALRHRLPQALLLNGGDGDAGGGGGGGRFRLVDRVLPFDAFDALLQFCDVFIGNDSGPKHLASLRGAPVVSVHSSRINWDDWGQEQTGVIVSRKVPCAGCLLYHDEDECGKDWACIRKISPEEVFGAVLKLVRGAAPVRADG